MAGRIYPTKREAIHQAYNNCPDKKNLAWVLNWSKEEISQRTTLSDEGRRFPADDDKHDLATFMKTTGDFSYLFTLAAECGFECRPAQDRFPEMLAHVSNKVQELGEQLGLLFKLANVNAEPSRKAAAR